MEKINPSEFEITQPGTSYKLPEYRVISKGLKKTGENLEIGFVRGSISADDSVKKSDGILHEALIEMQICDLSFKNGLVPSRETAMAITKLQEALFWLQCRQSKRRASGAAGTYKR